MQPKCIVQTPLNQNTPIYPSGQKPPKTICQPNAAGAHGIHTSTPAALSEGLTSKRNSHCHHRQRSCDTPSPGLMGTESLAARRPWAKGSSQGAAVVAFLWLGAPAHSRFKPTALYPAPTGVRSCTAALRRDMGVEESCCSEMKGKEKTAASAWPGRQQSFCQGQRAHLEACHSHPKTQLWNLTAVTRDSLKEGLKEKTQEALSPSFCLGIVCGVTTAWNEREITCRKVNITMTWAGAAGVVEKQRQSAEMET